MRDTRRDAVSGSREVYGADDILDDCLVRLRLRGMKGWSKE